MTEGFTITRVFDAPRERVWREWTEPESFADWFGGEEAEVPLSTVSMDLRVGGKWRATMFFGPNRSESNWHGEFRELIPPERLVMTISDQPEAEPYELLIVVFTELGDGRTEMHFQQLGHHSAKHYEATRKGWGKFFDRVEARLASA